MPSCGCFHSYKLTLTAANRYELELSTEGEINLKGLLARAGLVQTVSVKPGWFAVTYTLSGVRHGAELRQFLDLLTSVIVIDLSPYVIECYALGPHTVFEDGEAVRTQLGELFYQTKYRSNQKASTALLEKLIQFIGGHPRLRRVGAIVAAPKSEPTTPDFVGRWVRDIAARLRFDLLMSNKIRTTAPQKDLTMEQGEDEAAARVANSIQVQNVRRGAAVLILDDTIRSGGTLKEVARALKEAGAGDIYGLSVAKDAKFTQGGIDLAKERWE